jgi:hypothetical protein
MPLKTAAVKGAGMLATSRLDQLLVVFQALIQPWPGTNVLPPFDPGNAEADHHAVVQLGAATTDASAKAHDGIAVNAGQPLNPADAHTLAEGGDDLDLLIAGKDPGADAFGPEFRLRHGRNPSILAASLG